MTRNAKPMSDTIWPVGTDSGKRLREELRTFIGAQLALPKYKDRLPRQHFAVLGEGEVEKAGRVQVRVVSGPDEKTPWPYDVGALQITQALQEWHAIQVVVKSDKKTGGADAASAFVGVFRDMFSVRFGLASGEREALENAGIYNCRVLAEGFQADPGGETDEGTFFTQQLALRASTDTFLN